MIKPQRTTFLEALLMLTGMGLTALRLHCCFSLLLP